ncbi:hypothetical protein QBC39DRAFT_20269 [Podospora conica]|nr:hypothetical protein QBC39DRAFT_20269 [Schizothecium conicum]
MPTHHHHTRDSLLFHSWAVRIASHRMAAGTGHGHAQPFFPSGNFLPVSAKNCRVRLQDGIDVPQTSASPRAARAKQHRSYRTRTTKSRMLWIPRSPTSTGLDDNTAPSRAAQTGIHNRQSGRWDDGITTTGISRERGGSASQHGRSQLGKRWRAVDSGPVECQDTPDTSPGRSMHLCATSSLRPAAGLRGTASDGFLLLGAILEWSHRQAGRLLWCWRSRWVHVSRGRRHLGDLGAGLSISVVPAACRHPTPQPLIRRRPAPVSGHSAELRKS